MTCSNPDILRMMLLSSGKNLRFINFISNSVGATFKQNFQFPELNFGWLPSYLTPLNKGLLAFYLYNFHLAG
jgi:hypothetical protein